MPTPINSANGGGQFLAMEVNGPQAGASGSPVVIIEPVVIDGDAGAQALVKRYDEGSIPPCQVQTAKAMEGVVPLVSDFVMALASPAAGPVVVGVALANLFHSAFEEGGKLRDLYDCKTR
jgi:hypothetical protein